MRRGIAVAVVGLISLAGGCASPAHFVEKKADSGIIAIPANTNAWPGYNRREAEALIQKHVGPNYEILEEREVVTGQSTTNNQQTNTEAVQNKRNPNLPGERQTTTSTTMQQDVKEWRIWYRKTAAPMNAQPNSGLMQTGGVHPQGPGHGPPPGVMPSVLPGGGPTSYFGPSSRPRPASVQPACKA